VLLQTLVKLRFLNNYTNNKSMYSMCIITLEIIVASGSKIVIKY